MASYRGHLRFSSALGVAYGGLAYWQLGMDPATAGLAAMVTAVGGLMPDLDSDSGVPVRELFNFASIMVPLLLLRRLASAGFTPEEMLVACGGVYCFVRYGLRRVFRHMTVHRGMFHSIPAMLIAGLIVYLEYHHPSLQARLLLAVGVMIGFLSHLVLDELCSVDLNGKTPKLNQFAGTAVKFTSKSTIATAFAYLVLAGLGYLAYVDFQHNGELPANMKLRNVAEPSIRVAGPAKPPAAPHDPSEEAEPSAGRKAPAPTAPQANRPE
jgi:hypothetical protein